MRWPGLIVFRPSPLPANRPAAPRPTGGGPHSSGGPGAPRPHPRLASRPSGSTPGPQGFLALGRIQGGNRCVNILADAVTWRAASAPCPGVGASGGLKRPAAAVRGLAQATGAEINLTVEPLFPMLKNDPDLRTRRCRPSRPCWGRSGSNFLHPPWAARTSPTITPGTPASLFLGVRTPGARPGPPLPPPPLQPRRSPPLGPSGRGGLLACLGNPIFPPWPRRTRCLKRMTRASCKPV